MFTPESPIAVPVAESVERTPQPWQSVPLAVATPAEEGRQRLRLAGALPERWCWSLADGCARHGISLLTGSAERDHLGRWAAELELETVWSGPNPDFLALATSEPATQPAPPKLLDFELFEERDRPGEVALEVHAWEGLGLLAGVLACVDGAGLAVRELLLETEQDCAFQQLGLVRHGGGSPSPAARRQLLRRLRALRSSA